MHIEITPNQAAFIDGYIEAFYFSDTGGDTDIPENTPLSDDAKKRATIECLAFLYRVECFLDTPAVSESFNGSGHDFYLTRCGHGCGYWDDYKGKKYGPYSDVLTRVAESFGNIDFYLSDTGAIES